MGFQKSESLMNPVGEIKLTSPRKVGARLRSSIWEKGPREDPYIAPSFTPQRGVGECALDPSAPPLFNPESPEDEFASENEELYRAYFGRGTNVIILKEGRLECEEESCVLVNAANKYFTGIFTGQKRQWKIC